MRRMFVLLLAAAITVLLVMPVCAATDAKGVAVHATVSSDSSCQVTVTADLHLEQAQEKLTFPVPKDATNVTLNGNRVRTSSQNGVRLVDLSKVVGNATGNFSVSIHYTLNDVIHTDKNGILQLQLPLLSGFAYPVETMEFSVTLPGEFSGMPSFSSGYHQADIEKHMTYSVSGATVSGSFLQGLKDRETLTMTLGVTETMFPQSVIEIGGYDFGKNAMVVCAVLAFLYWLLFLRNVPIWRGKYTVPPEGYSAGEMGCVLHVQGANLSLMVLTWAQLGYVQLQRAQSGRVLVQKRMDMGNERGETELRVFRKLFARRDTVDTTGTQYAQLCELAAKKPAGIRELIHPRSGNLQVFRGLSALIGLFGGVTLAVSLSQGAALQPLVVFLLAVAGGISGWLIQSWAGGLLLYDKGRLRLSLACCGAWLLLGLIAGQFSVSLWMVAGLLTAGLLLAFGGRRTDLGRQIQSEVLGLRKYLRTVPKQELQRICAGNPEYFYSLMPYAMALGVGKAFAKRFGKARQPDCPYISIGKETYMTAVEWSKLMTQTVESMDARSRQMPMEKLIAFVRGLIK